MSKNTIKKVLPMLAGALVIALVVSILPSWYFAEAGKNINTKIESPNYITLEKAEIIALNKVNNKSAEVIDYEEELGEKIPNYDFEIITEDSKYEVEINAITGDILEYKVEAINEKHEDNDDHEINNNHESNDDHESKDDHENHDEDHSYNIKGGSVNSEINKPVVDVKYITKEKAIEIAHNKIGSKATLEDIDFDEDDNPPKYEIEMHDDKYEYEIEIHAITGAVLEFERDLD